MFDDQKKDTSSESQELEEDVFEKDYQDDSYDDPTAAYGATDATPGAATSTPAPEIGQPQQSMPESELPPISSQNNQEPEKNFSSVSATAGSKKVMLGILMAFLVVVLYFGVIDNEPATVEEKKIARKEELEQKKEELLDAAISITPTVEEGVEIKSAPVLPEPPPVEAPLPPAPPPPPVPAAPPTPVIKNAPEPLVAPPTFDQIDDANSGLAEVFGIKTKKQKDVETKKKKFHDRRGANIMVFGGGGSKAEDDEEENGEGGKKDGKKGKKQSAGSKPGFLGFSEGALEEDNVSNTSAEQVNATMIGKLDNMIAQGKVIYAILETAINTDLEGMVRGVIARDVYAERNRTILIPKGSRIIGTYASEVKAGQTRVGINWDRIIRPDGIDIQIGSPGTDQLGRAGVHGQLDNKFWTRLGAAFLVTYLMPKIAREIEDIGDDNVTTASTANTDGSVTTTRAGGSSKSEELRESAEKFKEITEDVVKGSFAEKPTIHVPQGVRVNILVQKDLIFPSNIVLKKLKTKKEK